MSYTCSKRRLQVLYLQDCIRTQSVGLHAIYLLKVQIASLSFVSEVGLRIESHCVMYLHLYHEEGRTLPP